MGDEIIYNVSDDVKGKSKQPDNLTFENYVSSMGLF